MSCLQKLQNYFLNIYFCSIADILYTGRRFNNDGADYNIRLKCFSLLNTMYLTQYNSGKERNTIEYNNKCGKV